LLCAINLEWEAEVFDSGLQYVNEGAEISWSTGFKGLTRPGLNLFFFFTEVRGATSNSAYYGYPEVWILRYPAHRYHAVPWPGFEPTTRWLRVRRPNHSATTLHDAEPLESISKVFSQLDFSFTTTKEDL
jgi:hypothetical protein